MSAHFRRWAAYAMLFSPPDSGNLLIKRKGTVRMVRTTTVQKSFRIAVPSSWSSDQKGAFLEDIAKQALRRQSYDIIERIRFTGMEIDLLGTHKPSGDKVYIECKFYEKNISANVLDLMVGQGFRRRIPRLALFSVSSLSKDAKGALDELKTDERLSFSFYGPDQMLEPISPLRSRMLHYLSIRRTTIFGFFKNSKMVAQAVS